ncbi:MAG: protease inhibitor I42 family protein [Chloroflexi bacterium]|nr:protease inhibitor I42 family protein [Chloroflexota bacterium]
MIKNWFTAICLILVLSVVLVGCAPAAQSPAAVSVTYDDFQKQNNVVRDINVSNGETITVTLFSNATTGFKWVESTQISDPQVLQQVDHKYIAPGDTGGKVGVGGTEVWSFKALKAGKSTISTEYSQPWEKGTKGTWTFKLNVTVK